mmetsp:Transcript_46180/g.117916  ORF Transcript_46180/g.117916 Transcript_46180/m.117916 type:complete len:287 (-) Transcript_46180:178-1038(-)|eukprot:jgi/Tetstr1/448300/TSEL_035586.t1
MSVVTHSPICGSKRFFEHGSPEPHHPHDSAWSDSGAAGSFAKRVRRARGSPFGCGSQPGRLTPAVLQHLADLFPQMEKEVICSVLYECGDNIDAAIKRLGELRLSAAKDADAGKHGAAYVQEVQVSVQATGEAPEGDVAAAKPAAAEPAQEGARSADDWINTVVAEMAAASDMDDARLRAAKVLQTFEQQVQKSTKEAAKGEQAALTGQLAELQRDNGILKRAVQIQNARMQELAEKDQEVTRLQQMLQQYQEKVTALELSNYSLTLHLRQAESAPMPLHRHPDVF